MQTLHSVAALLIYFKLDKLNIVVRGVLQNSNFMKLSHVATEITGLLDINLAMIKFVGLS